MSLHVDTFGSGEPLLLIHGWGMHGGVWADVAQRLAEDFEVHVVDLPGYGKSGKQEAGSRKGEEVEDSPHSPLPASCFPLDALVAQLSAQFPEPLNLCGWSLGGLVSLHWALREPEKVKRLVLVTSTPCFVQCADWPHGMPQETLAQFAAELERDHAATLRRFLALQLRGSENERALLAVLRERLFSRGEPDRDALRGGLEILRDADLRGELSAIRQPALVIAGERDRLTPPAASHHLAQALPDARLVEVAGAAHVPFLSHAEAFVEQVKVFIGETQERNGGNNG